MAQLLEYIKMAVMNITSNKGRSILTMLGIIIGISSVIMVISIGNGVSDEINGELENLAGGQLYIYSDTEEFTTDDFDAIKREVEHIKGVSPDYSAWGLARSPKGEFESALGCGTVDYQYVFNDPIVKGKYFSQAEYDAAASVCVIRESGAKLLFGTTDVIGKEVEFEAYGHSIMMKIIGVRKDNSAKLLGGSSGELVEMEMPITTLGQRFGWSVESYSGFYVVADSSAYSTRAASKVVSLMKRRHQITDDTTIQMSDFNDSVAEINQIIGMITIFVVFVAAISLLVGGIGVMNIMLVSVTERTREIGIRKSLGAKTKSIMLQFLAEAAIISLFGGVIGIVLGILGAFGVCALIGFAAKVKVSTVLLATLFSSGVGIFFGMYPAKRAARLSPIDALRHE